MINEYVCAHVHTPRGKFSIDDYSQRYPALLIPGGTIQSYRTVALLVVIEEVLGIKIFWVWILLKLQAVQL